MGAVHRFAGLAACCLHMAAAGAFAQSASSPAERGPESLPPELPLRRDSPASVSSSAWLAGTALLALAGLGGALVAARRGRLILPLARRRATEPGRQIERLASQALTPQASVHAIRWNGEELLVGCCAQQLTVLARQPAHAQKEPA